MAEPGEEEVRELRAAGLRGQSNLLLYSCPPTPSQHVVFFQGDTQDLRARMEAQYVEISRWKEFCLERTCVLLRRRFPGAAVWAVRPSRMLRNLFSSFHHFVSSSITGVPQYDREHGALAHTQLLLEDAVRQARDLGHLSVCAEGLPVVLVGFSKGCVVLNQLVHEVVSFSPASGASATHTPSSTVHRHDDHHEHLESFVGRLRAMYWLDSGHSGTSGAYVTDDDLLAGLVSLGVSLEVHVTPHQVVCPQRPWIGEEEREFVSKLRQLGARVTETVHFEKEEVSLERHFKVLEVF